MGKRFKMVGATKMGARCVATGDRGAERHHILTRKARPDLAREAWNMIPISRRIHVEWHLKGTTYMVEKYPGIASWMREREWEWDVVRKKWTHPMAQFQGSEKLLGTFAEK